MTETISNNGEGTILEVVAVDLLPNAGIRTEVLEVAVESVGEVEIAILWMDGKVVERVELAAKVVVHESCVGLECMLYNDTLFEA